MKNLLQKLRSGVKRATVQATADARTPEGLGYALQGYLLALGSMLYLLFAVDKVDNVLLIVVIIILVIFTVVLAVSVRLTRNTPDISTGKIVWSLVVFTVIYVVVGYLQTCEGAGQYFTVGMMSLLVVFPIAFNEFFVPQRRKPSTKKGK
jgi:uncharacterized membrane protein YhaH (DUF805 family)